MFRTDFRIALRNLVKRKSRTAVSLFSLVVGLTAFILLMLHARRELSADSFFAGGDRVYRLGQYLPGWKVGGSNYFASTSGIVAPTLKREFPDVDIAVRTKEIEAPLVFNKKAALGRGLYADRDFLEMFPFPMREGGRTAALAEPFSVVLSLTMAGKLFGRESAVGRTVIGERGRELKVTGVMEDMPGNTHLRCDYLVSFLTLYVFRDDIDTAWPILNYNSYIRLRPGVSGRDFETKLPGIVAKYHPESAKDRRYFLTPLREVHFATGIESSGPPPVDKKSIFLLMSIAVLILVTACVNHINLATAGAEARGREVGIRKSVGATRGRLVRQFLGESFVLTFLSALLSLAAVVLLLPAFSRIAGTEIPLRALADGKTLAWLLGLVLGVGVLAGGYPAFVLSALNPARVMKRSSGPASSGGRLGLRNGLIVFQFGVTIVLAVAAVVVQKQLRFIRSRDIGYNRDNVVAVRLWDPESRRSVQAIREELAKNPLIAGAAAANTVPLSMTEMNDIRVETENGEMIDVPMVTTYFIDDGYVDLFRMTLTAGRSFSRDRASDIDRQVVINETAARLAGLKNPIGKKIVKWGQDMRIIGVVKDFHFASFKTKIEPLMFSYEPRASRVMLIKIAGRDIGKTLDFIGATFRRFSPNFADDQAFMDDLYDGLYKDEGNLGRVILGFSILALIIAVIGLYGLVSFVTARKTKEIGIRKVLGASVPAVMGLILKKFLWLIGAAALAAIPVAYAFSRGWLQGFVYRIGLSAGIFVFSLAVIMAAALVSVAGQTAKAALANPVKSLRRE